MQNVAIPILSLSLHLLAGLLSIKGIFPSESVWSPSGAWLIWERKIDAWFFYSALFKWVHHRTSSKGTKFIVLFSLLFFKQHYDTICCHGFKQIILDLLLCVKHCSGGYDQDRPGPSCHGVYRSGLTALHSPTLLPRCRVLPQMLTPDCPYPELSKEARIPLSWGNPQAPPTTLSLSKKAHLL